MIKANPVRSIICWLCILSALAIVAVMICDALPWPDRYTSVHPVDAVPPLVGLSPESVFNIGDAKALDAFPGVGEVISQRIIETRSYLEGFVLPEDLMLVKGIGIKTFEKIMAVYDEPLVENQAEEN